MSPSLPSWHELRRFTPVFVFGALFLLGGLALPWIGEPPAFDELLLVEGEVELVKRTPKTRYGDRKITIVLGEGASRPGSFDAGLCHQGTQELLAGERIRVWLDGEPSRGAASARAWQIQAGDAVLCDYAVNLEASQGAAANARVMGASFALIGLALLLAPLFAHRRVGRSELSR